MRIISGEYKGKKINYIKSSTTRPLRDIVKESIFNIINHSNSIEVEVTNSKILDLYSGTGSFGLECFSRGAKEIVLVEKDPQSISVLKKNLNLFSYNKKIKLFERKVDEFLVEFSKKNYFDIIFLDPPYQDKNLDNLIINIKKKKIFKNQNLVIVHQEENNKNKLTNLLRVITIKKYGRSKIIFGNL